MFVVGEGTSASSAEPLIPSRDLVGLPGPGGYKTRSYEKR
jgi:hypothetical protein